MVKLESALVVLVPAAEALIGPFRARYDPGAAAGVPAHVTVLYPFKSPDAIDAALREQLAVLFRRIEAVQFSLTALRRFADETLYLAVEPEAPFRRLTRAAWDFSPDTPPYGGRYPDIVPHLTVARGQDGERLAAITQEFAAAAHGRLPLRTQADAVALMDTRAGRWQVRCTIPLAPR